MATTTVPPLSSALWHFHANSETSEAMPRDDETGLPVAAVFHLRMTETRRPLSFTRDGDVDVPDDGIRWMVLCGQEDVFLGPLCQVRSVVTDLLHQFLDTVSTYVVEESILLSWVDSVSYIVSSTAVLAREAGSCGVTTNVHICCVLQEEGESSVGGGGGGVIGRALLESRESYERDEGFGGVPALESAIEALETATYEGRVGKEDSCPICLEELVGGEVVKTMPCGHLFHGGCIVDWLGKSHTCPLCRFAMPKRPPPGIS